MHTATDQAEHRKFTVELSDSEHAHLEAEAAQDGVQPSEVIRKTAMDQLNRHLRANEHSGI